MGMDRIMRGTAALDDVLLFVMAELSGVFGVLIEQTAGVPRMGTLPLASTIRRGEAEPDRDWIEVHVLPDFVNVETRQAHWTTNAIADALAERIAERFGLEPEVFAEEEVRDAT